MALKFLEGCELYGGFTGLPNSFQRKWGAVTQYYQINVGQTGRTPGTYALSLSADWNWQGDLITTPAFTARDEWVVGFAYKRQTTSINGNILRAYNGATCQLELKQSGTSITLARGENGTVIHTWTGLPNDTNWHHIQLKFKISPTAGYAQLIYDAVNRGTSATNLNTQNSAPATVDRIMFLAPSGSGTTGYNSIACYFDDIYICDTTGTTNNDFLGNSIIEGIVPNSEGSFSQLQRTSAGSNWDAVSDLQASDETDYVRARYPGIKDSYNFTNLTKVLGDVKGIQVNIVGKNVGAGNTAITPIIRTASTNYDLAEQVLSSTTLTEVSRFNVVEVNPNTNEQWSILDVNTSEFGVKTTAQSEAPVWITTTLPNAGKNTAYNASLIATNDATYSVTSGSLPDGMSLNSATGLISGTNTTISATTRFTFTITATNSFGSSAREFIIPVFVPTDVQIFAWGAGGAGGSRGGWGFGAVGGAGGAANAYFPIFYPLDVVVGGGGVRNSTSLTVGGGGIASRNGSDNQYGGGGGGYSGAFKDNSALIIAGGGGGGGSALNSGAGNVGGGGGGLVGQDGASPYNSRTNFRGRGGTQTTPGENSLTDSINTNGFQAALIGGSPRTNSYGGAGGGGYFGGSAGGYSSTNPGIMGGGGGGSGFIHPSGFNVVTPASLNPSASPAVANNIGYGNNAYSTDPSIDSFFLTESTASRVICRWSINLNHIDTTIPVILSFQQTDGTADFQFRILNSSFPANNAAFSSLTFLTPYLDVTFSGGNPRQANVTSLVETAKAAGKTELLIAIVKPTGSANIGTVPSLSYTTKAIQMGGTLTAGVGTTPGDSANSLRSGAGAAGAAGTTGGADGGAGSGGRVVLKYLLPVRGSGGTITNDGTHVYHTFSTAGSYRLEAPVWITDILNNAVPNAAYSESLVATNNARYDIISGSLPSGMSLNSTTGVISGTYTGSPATFTFTIAASNIFGSTSRQFTLNAIVGIPIELLMLAGGGGGASSGSGGGAGGVIHRTYSFLSLDNQVTSQITVGAGGVGGIFNSTWQGSSGSNSIFNNGISLTTIGGGGGITHGGGNGVNGGCGSGGAISTSGSATTGGIGSQGFNGGAGFVQGSWVGCSGGGGGIGEAGVAGSNTAGGGRGGNGLAYSITGSSVTYGGGGGGGTIYGSIWGAGGTGGGGAGGSNDGVAGTANTGGGGGGSRYGWRGANGGSGVVIIAYPNTYPALIPSVGLTFDQPTRSGYRVYRFTAGTGTIRV